MKKFTTFLMILFITAASFAQTAIIDIPITISDGAGGSRILKFGLDPLATDGIDALLGEAALPPLPPSTIFDARFNLPGGTESSLRDYRTGIASFNGQKIHEIQYQVGSGTSITLNWAFPLGITGRLQDVVTGTIIDIQMANSGSFQVTNPGSYNKLKLTITYFIPLPAVPTLYSPPNNSIGQPTSLTLTWGVVPGAISYHIQVATDALFTNLIVNDSLVLTSYKNITGLINNTQYFWRVNSKNGGGFSAYSEQWTFKTMPPSQHTAVLDIPLTITDGTGGVQILRFGLDPDASDGIDVLLGESPLPPLPPATVFDARFNLPNGVEASTKDYRICTTPFSGQKIHEIEYQVGFGTSITINWVFPSGVTGRLQDKVTGTYIDVQMNGNGSFQVTNPGTFNKLKFTVNYNSVALVPSAPYNLQSFNYATGIVLTWGSSATNHSGFVLERKLGDSLSAYSFTSRDTIAPNAVSYQDYAVAYWTSYSYRLYAFAGNLRSGYSNISTIMFLTPVELLNFSATAENGTITVKWGTATEKNNHGFQVELIKLDSKTNSEWVVMGFAKGKGTTTEMQNYIVTLKSVQPGTYKIRIKQIDLDGSSTYYYLNSEIKVEEPLLYALNQNYPNPFNPSTRISYSMPYSSNVKISIYNSLGEVVKELVNQNQEPNIYEIEFDASNMSSGVYFCKIQANSVDGKSSFSASRKMLLVK